MQYLLALLLINAFVLLLCGALTLAGRLLRQTGRVRLQINEQPREADCGQSLLNALAQQNVFLPAACGGKGTCGRCELRVTEGGGSATTLEKLQLPADRLAALARLACQAKVRGDMKVEIAAALLGAGSYLVTLAASEKVAADIRTLRFRLPEGRNLDFLPGQYMQIVFNQPWERVLRAYSISSSPAEKQSFSLDVQLVAGGLVSSHLHAMQPGDQIEVTGPFGDMTLSPQQHTSPLLLVAGGVGLAPLRSMVAALQATGFSAPVFLFHGARSRENLYNEEFFRTLARSCPNFHYFPALSRPMLEDGWTGPKGMIHEILAEKLPGLPAAGLLAFVCGPKPMMEAVGKVLVAGNVASDRIFTDPFDF